jgi:hypothetical protein
MPGTIELLKSSQLYPWVFHPRARRWEPDRRWRGRARARKQARWIGRWGLRRAAAAEQRRRARGKFDGGEGKDLPQPRAAQEASM